ncbi:MarR family transcriptional regulator [Nocardia colli]|uniref:MarR family transcriptional regulator n=1 Tax=Nocardia colli TaxID=2545717 RepID=A0A5N0DWH3_9NOCA|nr:MarR family transcriptional regulator [Nocardia colli]KAA8880409.1 MarR family transcriptional regulator [Nocardia colli]
MDENDPVDAIALAWLRERPGTPVDGIGVVTRIWHLAKAFGDDRRRVLAVEDTDAATLDLLSVLRRSGSPYQLTTRELRDRTMLTAGAISQRVARAEGEGLVTRAPLDDGSRAVVVSLTAAGHAMIERLVDHVLGREYDLLSALTAEQQADLTELLRILHQDLMTRLGTHKVTQVGSDDA